VIEQLGARVHALGPREEEAQQAKLGRAQRHLAVVDGDAVRGRVEPKRPGFERLLHRLRRPPPQLEFLWRHGWRSDGGGDLGQFDVDVDS